MCPRRAHLHNPALQCAWFGFTHHPRPKPYWPQRLRRGCSLLQRLLSRFLLVWPLQASPPPTLPAPPVPRAAASPPPRRVKAHLQRRGAVDSRRASGRPPAPRSGLSRAHAGKGVSRAAGSRLPAVPAPLPAARRASGDADRNWLRKQRRWVRHPRRHPVDKAPAEAPLPGPSPQWPRGLLWRCRAPRRATRQAPRPLWPRRERRRVQAAPSRRPRRRSPRLLRPPRRPRSRLRVEPPVSRPRPRPPSSAQPRAFPSSLSAFPGLVSHGRLPVSPLCSTGVPGPS